MPNNRLIVMGLLLVSVASDESFAQVESPTNVIKTKVSKYAGVPVEILATINASNRPDAVADINIQYDLEDVNYLFRSRYSGVEYIDDCGRQIVYEPPELATSEENVVNYVVTYAVRNWRCETIDRNVMLGWDSNYRQDINRVLVSEESIRSEIPLTDLSATNYLKVGDQFDIDESTRVRIHFHDFNTTQYANKLNRDVFYHLASSISREYSVLDPNTVEVQFEVADEEQYGLFLEWMRSPPPHPLRAEIGARASKPLEQ